MKYSLLDYVLTISLPTKLRTALGITTISVGGEGSYLDNFTFAMATNTWAVKGDATGSWIHEKSNDRTGTASITLNMMSPQIMVLTRLFNTYFTADNVAEGVTITLSDAASNTVVTCNDCFVQKLPDLTIKASPDTREWNFVCGQIILN